MMNNNNHHRKIVISAITIIFYPLAGCLPSVIFIRKPPRQLPYQASKYQSKAQQNRVKCPYRRCKQHYPCDKVIPHILTALGTVCKPPIP
nr:hypothetical protein [Arsenophonus endosymbiont of Aleurodicus floccissimus]